MTIVLIVFSIKLASAALVIVDPSSPSFLQDAADWNAAASSDASTLLPSIIYFAYNSNDVVDAVRLALSQNVSIVARSGRHSYTGLGGKGRYCVIDVSNMTSVTIASAKRNGAVPTVLVDAGARQYDAQVAALNEALMFPSGTCPTVGVAGFTLGGGYGFFSRKFSLNSDHILSVELVSVNASGSVVIRNVSAETNSDLLWALRGGGNNNFGVVTKLEVKLHQAPLAVSHVRLSFPNTSVCATAVQPLYDTMAPTVVQELSIQLVYYTNACDVMMVYLGNVSSGMAASQFEEQWMRLPGAVVVGGGWIGTSAQGMVNDLAGCSPTMSTADCLEYVHSRNPSLTNPSRFGALSVFVDTALGASGSEAVFLALESKPKSLGFAFAEVDPYGPTSAINRIHFANETSFPHRSSLYHIQLLVYWSAGALDEEARNWLGEIFTKYLAPLGSGSYRNYPNALLPDALTRYYKGNLKRLREVKAAIDPMGVFRTLQGL